MAPNGMRPTSTGGLAGAWDGEVETELAADWQRYRAASLCSLLLMWLPPTALRCPVHMHQIWRMFEFRFQSTEESTRARDYDQQGRPL